MTIELRTILQRPVTTLLQRVGLKAAGSIRISKKHAAVAGTAIAASVLMLAAPLVFPLHILANNDDVQTFTVDVALGLPYVQNNVNPAETGDDFSPGDTFIQDGNVYPGGTIPPGTTSFDPAMPGAIGTFRARGTFTTDLANFIRAVAHDRTAASDMALGTEMYTFLHNKSVLMTDGTWPNAHFSAARVVLGGTGTFRNAVGEVHEENIGENKYGFCNFRVTFRLRSVGDSHGR